MARGRACVALAERASLRRKGEGAARGTPPKAGVLGQALRPDTSFPAKAGIQGREGDRPVAPTPPHDAPPSDDRRASRRRRGATSSPRPFATTDTASGPPSALPRASLRDGTPAACTTRRHTVNDVQGRTRATGGRADERDGPAYDVVLRAGCHVGEAPRRSAQDPARLCPDKMLGMP